MLYVCQCQSGARHPGIFAAGDAAARYYVQGVILDTYRECGFNRIGTPAIENIELLDKSDGGENLNLIFKILKRGQKLDLTVPNLRENDLLDMGLRYDLTLPLSRYFANNRSKLREPFKVIQIDKVYRAETAAKGALPRVLPVRHRHFGRQLVRR